MNWTYATCVKCGNTFRYLTDGRKIENTCDKCRTKQYTKLTIDQIIERLEKLEAQVNRIEHAVAFISQHVKGVYIK